MPSGQPGAEVRSLSGTPVASDFYGAFGTPLVVDVATGRGWVMTSGDVVSLVIDGIRQERATDATTGFTYLNSSADTPTGTPASTPSGAIPVIVDSTNNAVYFYSGGAWRPGSAPFTDSTAIVKGSVDATKLLRFEVDGFTAGVTRVATPPDRDFTIGDASVLSAEQATTSGTLFDFTIPAWAKRITVMLEGVSTNGTGSMLCQLGDSGGIESADYAGSVAGIAGGAIAASAFSTGFIVDTRASAVAVRHGTLILTLKDQANNTWSYLGSVACTDTAQIDNGAGTKSLSGTLTTVRITTGAGDTFDAGSVAVVYE